jgi:hypothetical protein
MGLVRRLHWIYEINFDGYRALALRRGSETRILSQNEKDLGKKFPDELLLLGQFDFKPGSTAPAALVERIRPFRNQLRRTIISSVSERFSTFRPKSVVARLVSIVQGLRKRTWMR